MYRESEVLLAVLHELRTRGIVGLGLHDGLLVPASRAEEVREVMENLAEALTGYRLPVTHKDTERVEGGGSGGRSVRRTTYRTSSSSTYWTGKGLRLLRNRALCQGS
jgi:hypothetical protein